MLVGAAGPLVAAFVRGIPERHQLVATHAMLNTFVHVFKVAVFVAMGFAFAAYLPLILLMVMGGFAGTAVGSRMLAHVPENVFRLAFRILLSVVAVGLIWTCLLITWGIFTRRGGLLYDVEREPRSTPRPRAARATATAKS
jgi:uncharacterized membrane protein YfcA